jgi:chaperone required for assembly of F1-ATPase
VEKVLVTPLIPTASNLKLRALSISLAPTSRASIRAFVLTDVLRLVVRIAARGTMATTSNVKATIISMMVNPASLVREPLFPMSLIQSPFAANRLGDDQPNRADRANRTIFEQPKPFAVTSIGKTPKKLSA